MISETQRHFEREAESTLGSFMWVVACLGMAVYSIGEPFLIGMSAFVAGMWAGSVTKGLISYRALRKYYGVKRPRLWPRRK